MTRPLQSSAMPPSTRLIISAPFGNYVQPEGCTPTLGTFTAAARGGRVWRILKTVRYYPRLRAWVNKIGLRNPGMPWLCERVRRGKIDLGDKLVSVHGFSEADWYALLDACAEVRPMGLELNMSCPNVGAIDWPTDLFERALATGVPVVAKLPPVRFETMFEQAWAAGIRSYHCCNTLPVPSGGLSGAPLKPVALQCIARLREAVGADVEQLKIVGGGGIRAVDDVGDYVAAGVNAIAVGTKTMNPKYLVSQRGVTPLRERATAELGGRDPWLAAPRA